MAWSRHQLLLALVMIICGSLNTLTTKWADRTESISSDGILRKFEHPFLQSCCMFFGEMLCLVAFKILYKYYSRRGDGSEDVNELTKGNRNFNPFVLFIPAMCDMTATSIMYIGLNLTNASSFQMLRGSVIIFVGLLSVAFLERVLKWREWSGIFLVIAGLIIVGLTDFIHPDGSENSRNNIITGDLLIIMAQIITAVQMCVEEKYVAGLDIPALQAVGWEGVFGLTVLGALQIPFYFIHVPAPFSNNPRGVLEDALDAFTQIGNNYQLVLAILGTIVSIAFFNFAGISVTKEISATTRMVLDSVRTIVIWACSLLLFHQTFYALQLLGFVGLVSGMCLYNNITCGSVYTYIRALVIRIRYRNIDNSDADVEHQAADIAT